MRIYRDLQKKHGKQDWWPILRVTRVSKGNIGYHRVKVKRFAESEMFEICVGAILTQNTTWHNVEKALVNLKQGGFLSPVKIAPLNKKKLCQLIKPSGYYNQKARKLMETN